MSKKLCEDDFVNAVTVFHACLPRSGAGGRNDWLFLEALHYFAVHNITWRAMPERFDRLSKAGVFADFFDSLAGLSSMAHLIQMFDSAMARAKRLTKQGTMARKRKRR